MCLRLWLGRWGEIFIWVNFFTAKCSQAGFWWGFFSFNISLRLNVCRFSSCSIPMPVTFIWLMWGRHFPFFHLVRIPAEHRSVGWWAGLRGSSHCSVFLSIYYSGWDRLGYQFLPLDGEGLPAMEYLWALWGAYRPPAGQWAGPGWRAGWGTGFGARVGLGD